MISFLNGGNTAQPPTGWPDPLRYAEDALWDLRRGLDALATDVEEGGVCEPELVLGELRQLSRRATQAIEGVE